MCESFGVRLRQRREEQGIALSAIAEQTKIKQSLLEGLERDDVSRWPSGIFRRAFVRAYALAIGLQPDVVVREFLEKHPDPLEEITAASIAEAVEASSPSGPPTRLRYLVGAAVGSLSRFRSAHGQRRLAEADDRPHESAEPELELPELSGVFEPLDAVAIEAPQLFEPDEPYRPAECVEVAETGVDALDTMGAVDVPEDLPAVIETVTPVTFEPDLPAIAQLCTELSQVEDICDVAPLLPEVAGAIGAPGLIVWVWDPQAAALTPVLPHGYSDDVIAQLPNLPRDARNATAAAFRSAQTCSVDGGEMASDALVVPLLTRAGCAGVLAIELPAGAAQNEPIRALASIFAAQLARVVGDVRPAAAASRRLA